MANKTVSKENTNKENVSRETLVKGTTNNAGQEIKNLAPSADVISCTMTEEEHHARVERIHNKMEQGLRLSWDILVDITSAKERKEQTLDGYSDSTEDFNKWAMELFGMGETQVKQASRLIGFYGSIDDKGEYSLDDKYKRYTKEKLDIIQRIPQLKTKAQFDEVTESLGIMPSTSEGVLKQIVREAKGLPEKVEKTEEEKKAEKEAKQTAKDVKEIKESRPYIELESKRNTLQEFITNMRVEAKKVADSKDNKLAMAFVLKFIEGFNDMEKTYNEIGKNNEIAI